MKKAFTFIFVSIQVFATQQINDKLIYEDKIFFIHPIKLEYKLNNNVQATNCHRGYIATWKIINDSIFLEKINFCNSMRRNHELENKIGINQLVNWYSGEIIIPEYREIGKIDGNTLHNDLIFDIKNGVINKKVIPCLNEYGNLFSSGRYFYLKEDYVKALACFLVNLRKYPDYFKNDYTYLYIASSLKWLGYDSLSFKYQDSAKIKFPNNCVINELTKITADIKSLSNNELQVDHLQKNECEQIILVFPWVYPPSSSYLNSAKIMNNSFFSTDSSPADYRIEFTRREFKDLYQKVLKRVK
jgi:hypothetical protein